MLFVERYYSTSELAAQLDLKPATLAQWRHRGKGPAPTRINGAVRYSATAVNEWIAAQNEPTEPSDATQQQSTRQLVGSDA